MEGRLKMKASKEIEQALDQVYKLFEAEQTSGTRYKAVCYQLTESEQKNVDEGFSPANYIDYLNDEDICDECGESKVAVMFNPFGDGIRRGRRKCKCARDADKRWEEKQRREERERKLRELRRYSLMEEEFFDCTFGNWRVSNGAHGEQLYTLSKNYVERWDEMRARNVGLLLYGGVGTGKSFASFAIANELMNREVSVMAISMNGILQKIKSMFGDRKQNELDVIHNLKNADLLIIDDLGTESNTEWAKEKIYEVIDARYRSKKPIIITTNLPLEALSEKLKAEDGVSRIYDRINEMCQRFEVKGASRRVRISRNKRSVLDDLLNNE